MNAYLILLIWIFFIWLLTQFGKVRITINGKHRTRKIDIFLVAAFFAAFLLMALRGKTVGTDTANYLRYFDEVSKLQWRGLFSGGWDNRWFTTEKGFMVFEKLLSFFTSNGQWLIVLCAAIYIYCIYCFVEEYSTHTLLAAVTFLAIGSYLLAMNAMRQSVAVGLCCLGWLSLQKNNYKKSVFWILLAFTFHTSAIGFLLTILFKKLPANKKSITAACVITIIFAIAGSGALYWIINNFFPTYAFRYGRGRWNISEANGMIAVWAVIALIIVELIVFVDWKSEQNHLVFEIILCCMAYLGVNILGQTFDGFQRAAMFFQPFLILLFEEGGKPFKRGLSKFYYAGATVSMMLLFERASSTAQYTYSLFWQW